jgi:mannan polymerase II complex MNN11 subunit
MHFALPPRKTSHPPPYVRAATRSTSNRRKAQAKIGGLILFAIAAFWFILRAYIHTLPNHALALKEGVPYVKPKIVILTILDENTMSADFIHKVRMNRDDYAARHG